MRTSLGTPRAGALLFVRHASRAWGNGQAPQPAWLAKPQTAAYSPRTFARENAITNLGGNFMSVIVGISSAFLLLAGLASAFAGGSPGKYQVEGKNPDGSTYSGTAQIVATSEVTCRITWKTGSTTSEGICMRNGTSFAASYVLGDSIGLVVYVMNDDGSLEGAWTIADKDGVGEEILTPMQ
jgi:hypothetical protein